MLACLLLVVVSACKQEKLSDLLPAKANSKDLSLISSQSWRIVKIDNNGYYESRLAPNNIADFMGDGMAAYSNGFEDRWKVNGDVISFEKLGSSDENYVVGQFPFRWQIMKLDTLDFWIMRGSGFSATEIRFRVK